MAGGPSGLWGKCLSVCGRSSRGKRCRRSTARHRVSSFKCGWWLDWRQWWHSISNSASHQPMRDYWNKLAFVNGGQKLGAPEFFVIVCGHDSPIIFARCKARKTAARESGRQLVVYWMNSGSWLGAPRTCTRWYYYSSSSSQVALGM